jgi:hypothetical protein
MRTVLIGSDFMYDKDGNLKPIEINTAVGWHRNKIEDNESSLDLNELNSFITEQGFNKVVYIGGLSHLDTALSSSCSNLTIEYEYHLINETSITIPYIEDNETTLVIRSSYDTTALVDDTYCRDKVNFLNLIKDSSFGSQFAYLNESNEIINNITTINDNNGHPNFILKAVLPQYDKNEYPKLYKVTNEEELNRLISNVVTSDYFLMEFHFNPNELIENHIKVFRGLNLLFPPNLESISLGGYTRISDNSIESGSDFDSITFELIGDRRKYISGDYRLKLPKLLATDLVQMSDDTYKLATDLVVGDIIKTIDIPNPFDIDNNIDTINYKISLSELESGTTYSTNAITHIASVNVLSNIVKLTFTDGSDWFDNLESKYLSIRNNEVRFLTLLNGSIGGEFEIAIGDSVLLLDTLNTDTPTFVTKEIANIERLQQFFGGYEISVENARLFLTKSDVDSDKSYVSIEHNVGEYCTSSSPGCQQVQCFKGSYCIQTYVGAPYQACANADFCNCQTSCESGGFPIGKL